MRRLWRIIFNGIVVLSLVLCVATVGLWVRSLYRGDSLLRLSSDKSRVLVVETARGQLNVGVLGPLTPYDLDLLKLGGGIHYDASPSPSHIKDVDAQFQQFANYVTFFRHWHAAGFRWVSSGRGRIGSLSHGVYCIPPTRFAGVPFWFPALIFAVWPVRRLWMRRLRMRRSKRQGFCGVCGYDLRATPERCPECGKSAGSL